MNHPFVHLHVHSEYSLLDGAIRTKELARMTREYGMPAVALTDHGNMYGAIEFYQECEKAEVKPILGCEAYVDPEGHRRRDKGARNYHLLLLAENQKGYRNLVKLISKANTDGFYFKPRIDHELLSQYSEGIIASSACLAGEIPSFLREGREEQAVERALLYRDIMGEGNFFLEVMHNSIPEQAVVNKGLAKIAKKTGIPMIATNDAHYPKASDAEWHDILLCVQTNNTVDDPNRYQFPAQEFYFRSPEEMWQYFGDELPEALTNTVEIAERCNVTFNFGDYRLPHFEIPQGETLESYLEHQAWQGLSQRYGESVSQEAKDRLQRELGIINEMGYAGYFLIVADFINAAKERDIPVGPGRGSAAGSLVAFALGITEMDPLKYGLLFERFLNPERVSMPDIDTDISDKRRDEVLEYVVSKYGRENVSQIITFGRMMSRAAVRDVARTLNIPYAEANRVAKLVPEKAKTIPEALELSPDLKKEYENNDSMRRVLDVSSKIEGLARHCSQHAAGVVIAPCPITDIVPVRKIGTDQVVTQFAMEPVEKLGLVKMDFLGLRTLSILEDTIDNIGKNSKAIPDMNALPMDDKATFSLLQRAETMGVFQLESSGMRQMLKRLQVDCFEDLIAALALYRPGPLNSGMVEQFIRRKHGEEEVSYLHPDLKEVLQETHGVILYQEQVMKIASLLAGYSLGEADILRRAMAKKKAAEMEKQRDTFIPGCVSHGVAKDRAEELYTLIQEFAEYGFNKSHSAAYAMISYQTAYLKAHYKSEFLAAVLTSHIGTKIDDLARNVREVQNAGVAVLPPHVNESGPAFTVVGDVIRFGLAAVAKVGRSALETVVRVREEDGPFASFWDFMNRIDLRIVNKAVIENLIKSGALDNLGGNRREMLEALPGFMEIAQRKAQKNGQRSLLELVDEAEPEPELPKRDPFTLMEQLEMEKETLGLYISGHPVEEHEKEIQRFINCRIADIDLWKSRNTPITIGGLVARAKEKYTKNGDPMGIVEVEDTIAKIEVVLFPDTWEQAKPFLQTGTIAIITGKIQERGERTIIAQEAVSLEWAQQEKTPYCRFALDVYASEEKEMKEFVRELKGHPGDQPILLEVQSTEGTALVQLQGIKISGDDNSLQTIKERFPGLVELK
ncbi:MAG: DNA polymerase III subunit alpha [Synergistales bacterium]|nr:DNA polymerase III subunit alpha [Synergistales bacterium]